MQIENENTKKIKQLFLSIYIAISIWITFFFTCFLFSLWIKKPIGFSYNSWIVFFQNILNGNLTIFLAQTSSQNKISLLFPIFTGIGLGYFLLIHFNPIYKILKNTEDKNTEENQDSKWATRKDLIKMKNILNKGDGIIFGYIKEKGKKYSIEYTEPLSAFIIASPGAGKTSAVIIPTLFQIKNSVIVHDPKKEIYQATVKYRSNISKVMVYDPTSETSLSWNPLHKNELTYKTKDIDIIENGDITYKRVLEPFTWADIEKRISAVSNALIPVGKGQEEHWTRAAQDLFKTASLFLFLTNTERSTSIPEIYNTGILMGNPHYLIEMTEKISEIDECSIEMEKDKKIIVDRVLSDLTFYSGKDSKEYSSILSSFKTPLSIFAESIIIKNSTNSDFKFEDLRKEPISLYFPVDPTDQARLSKLIGLFFELATQTFFSYIPKKEEQKITFVIDEFPKMNKTKELIEMPALGRGYNLQALYVAQSESQIESIYSANDIKTLKNTCTWKVYMKQSEIDQAKKLSQTIGQKTIKNVSTSKKELSDDNNSYSISNAKRDLITADEIMHLHENVLIIKDGYPKLPIKAYLNKWYENKEYLKKSQMKLCEKNIITKPLSEKTEESVETKLEEQKKINTIINYYKKPLSINDEEGSILKDLSEVDKETFFKTNSFLDEEKEFSIENQNAKDEEKYENIKNMVNNMNLTKNSPELNKHLFKRKSRKF